MAEGRSRRGVLHVQLDYAFDRLRAPKLAQAYEILVPGRARRTGAAVKEIDYEDGSDLCPGLLGATARGAYDCEPDGGTDRVRGEPRSASPAGVGLRRRGL